MKQYEKQFSVQAMCRVLTVSKSGYFAWAKGLPSEREVNDMKLTDKIIVLHKKSRRTYGYRRIHADLKAEGVPCGKNRIARLMREQGIKPKTVKKFRVTADSKHNLPVQKNILNREFNIASLNQRWAGDITYIPIQNNGWLYLATVIDLCSRRVIGWSMSDRMQTSLVSDAMKMALTHRGIHATASLLWHSDRGSQYASYEYQRLLKQYGIKGSMSRKGNCWDNAVAESFFGSLKKELIHHENYSNREEAKRSIFEYLEVFYNRQRRHSSLGYLPPAEFERLMAA